MNRRLIALTIAAVAGGVGFAGQSAEPPMPDAGWLSQLLLLFGAIYILLAAIGMLRFPDVYTRLHASTKLVALGGVGILLGAALAWPQPGAVNRVLLIAAFFLLTAPLSGYMISRAGYLSGLEPWREEGSVDEWDACGDASELREGGVIEG